MMTLDSASPYIAANSPCADCNTLPECATSELTAQCTDQCVVIVCNDPDHGEASCGGDPEYAQCDPTCNEIYNCNGFDAFVSLSLGNTGLNLTPACFSYNVVMTTIKKLVNLLKSRWIPHLLSGPQFWMIFGVLVVIQMPPNRQSTKKDQPIRPQTYLYRQSDTLINPLHSKFPPLTLI